jgi:hypothetical protein
VGKFDGGKDYYFKGRIDELRIYNRALSETEISDLFRLSYPDSPPGASNASPEDAWSFR